MEGECPGGQAVTVATPQVIIWQTVRKQAGNMRIGDLPQRDIGGIQVPELPVVRRDDPRCLLVMAALALTWMTTRGEPSDGNMRALFVTLGDILADVNDLDVDGLEDPRTTRMAELLAGWHDAVWYPGADAFVEAWNDANPGSFRPRLMSPQARCEHRLIEFAEEIPQALAALGFGTHAWTDRQEIARLTAGMSTQAVLTDHGVLDAITAVGERPKQAHERLAHADFPSLSAAFDASVAARIAAGPGASGCR
jgi:hypothetical protein